jgi:hypothetical protein
MAATLRYNGGGSNDQQHRRRRRHLGDMAAAWRRAGEHAWRSLRRAVAAAWRVASTVGSGDWRDAQLSISMAATAAGNGVL